MWNDSFSSMLAMMVMAILMRAVYELGRPSEPGTERSSPDLLPATMGANHSTPGLTPLQKEWSEKAVKRYAEAQEKKWRKWNDAMFEAK